MAKKVNKVVLILKDAIAKIEGENSLNSLNSQDAEHQPSTTPSTSSLSGGSHKLVSAAVRCVWPS